MIRGDNYNWTTVDDEGEPHTLRLFEMDDIHLANCLDFVRRRVMSDNHYAKNNLSGHTWIASFEHEQHWRHKHSAVPKGCNSIWRGQ